MKKIFKTFSFFLLIFLFSENLLAAPSRDGGFNFYMAAGPNFIVPTALRAGWNRWEFGILGRNFIGANKTFISQKSSVYSGFGVGLSTDSSSNLGFQASVGVNYDLFWGIGFRAEMLANAVLNGTANAYGLVGVSYGF